MIPPLAALIAAAEDPRHRSAILALLHILPSPHTKHRTDHVLVRDEGLRVRGSDPARERELWIDLPESMRRAAPREIDALPIRRLVPVAAQHNLGVELLRSLTPQQLVPQPSSTPDAISLAAGLWMVHDHLDQCHELAQAADEAGRNKTGAYWHGIMHRREPDYDNARYWFRRVASHPVFDSIGAEVRRCVEHDEFAAALAFDGLIDRRGRWDPMRFIDLCAECGEAWNGRAEAAARLQEIEMRHLLVFTAAQATG